MLVNNNIIDGLCNDAGELRTSKALNYKNTGKVNITKVIYDDENNFEIHADVSGTEIYKTYIEIKNGEIQTIDCDCPDYYNTYGVCKHSLATILTFNDIGMNYIDENKYNKINNKHYVANKYNSFNQIVKTLFEKTIVFCAIMIQNQKVLNIMINLQKK